MRIPSESELDALAQLWHDVWFETHVTLAPPGLARLRTFENFRERLAAGLDGVRVVGPQGAPVGFCWIKDDELHQLWVSQQARGSGVAADLITDAESRLAARGVKKAWLGCAVGNHRAARFYEKAGWKNVGTIIYAADTAEGPRDVEVWRFEREIG